MLPCLPEHDFHFTENGSESLGTFVLPYSYPYTLQIVEDYINM